MTGREIKYPRARFAAGVALAVVTTAHAVLRELGRDPGRRWAATCERGLTPILLVLMVVVAAMLYADWVARGE